MTSDDAIYILDILFKNKPFNDTKEKVFHQIWEGKTYEEIAEELDYEISYIKHIGACLLRSLSQTLGFKVTKSNCRSVFRKIYGHLELMEISDSEDFRTENFSDNNSLDKKLQKLRKIKKLCMSNNSDSDVLASLKIDREGYETFLKNVQFELEDLLLDLINYPPLVEDLFLKISEIRFKVKS